MTVLRTLVLALVLFPLAAGADSWTFAGTNPSQVLESYTLGQATRLNDGRILYLHGQLLGSSAATAIFDPSNNQWHPTSAPAIGKATLLADGRVLVTGDEAPSNAASIFDPVADTWTAVAPMASAHLFHTATLLTNGKVLVVGGDGSTSAELYDPTSDSWSSAGVIPERFHHTATRLPDGRVLIAGGYDSNEYTVDTAAIYDPTSNSWHDVDPMAAVHGHHDAFLLADGSVLIVGGESMSSAPERFNPVSETWSGVPFPPTQSGFPTAAGLADGRVLLGGGFGFIPTPPFQKLLRDSAIYDPTTNTWASVAPSIQARGYGTAVTLANGKVVVLGGLATLPSVEIYEVGSDSWTSPQAISEGGAFHGASTLDDGRVLVTGGVSWESLTGIAAAHLYDPISGLWTQAASMVTARSLHTSTTLASGKVLVAGGRPSTLASCELYNPLSNAWEPAMAMNQARYQHTATRLQDGRVLVAGGLSGTRLATAEIYNPTANTWTAAMPMSDARAQHTATRLPDGRVLVVGGRNTNALASVEVYDPVADDWDTLHPMSTARYGHTTTLLPDGRVLVVGGTDSAALSTGEIYDPVGDTWTATAPLPASRSFHTAALLDGGEVLVVAGEDENGAPAGTCKRYDPTTDSWSDAASTIVETGQGSTLTGLSDGTVLSVGGAVGEFPVARAERYDPSSSPPLAAGCPAVPKETCIGTDTGALAIKGTGDAAKNKLTWKWSKPATALTQIDFGAPTAGTAYSVCLYDQSGGTPVFKLGATIAAGGTCAGKPCWKAKSDQGWAYANKAGNADGIFKLSLKGGAAGKPKIQLTGKGVDLPLPQPVSTDRYFDQDTEVIIQLHRNDLDRCWTSRFDAPAKKNDGTQFKVTARP